MSGPLQSCSSSSSNPGFHQTPPDLDARNLSPVQQYRASVERIRQAFKQEQFQLPAINIPIPPHAPPFPENEDEVSLAYFGYSAPVVSGAASSVGSQLVSRTKPGARSAATGSNLLGAFLLGAAVVGAGTLFVARSYSNYADGMRRDILGVYGQIADDDVNRQNFVNNVEDVSERKLESYFNRMFGFGNPTSVGYLLLTRGIGADSFANYDQAHGHYQTSLTYNVQPNLLDCIRYVYARSLRLANQPQATITQQLDHIVESSPFYRLSQIERQVLADGVNEVFDGHTPACFICPITQDLMIQPAYYEYEREGNRYRHYFEREAIERWVGQHHRCPLRQQSLEVANLFDDNDLANSIALWNQTKLKNQ